MSADRPFIETARLRFSGLSQESYEDYPKPGDTRTYTIQATCTDEHDKIMANEGVRKTVTMKIDRILPGVDEKINDSSDEPSLFDDDSDPDEIADEPEDSAVEDQAAEPEPEAEPSNVTKLANPSFSNQD